jgi:ERCC4-related helicase
VKLEKDGNMSYVDMLAPTKPLFNEDIKRVEKVLDLKHEVWKLADVCFKQFEEKKKDFKTI